MSEKSLKSFIDTLKEIRRGEVVTDLTVELHDLVAAVRATGKKGELTIVIKVKPASKGDVNTLVIEDEVKVKLPKPEKGTTILFATDDNMLQRNDPRQPELKGLRAPGTVTAMPEREASGS